MEIADTYHAMIDTIIATTGLSDTVLHIHAGMAIYLLAQLMLRTRRASLNALTMVFALEAANETMDRLHSGSWNWPNTLSDFAATMFWPLMIVIVGRYRRQRWARMEAHRTFVASMGLAPIPTARPARRAR
ncbi:hypothetical protein [Sphingomonas sp.]|uniref:hypothetical protein n=1 Tax=Sphingomonas sp. TaxID=28214 RepID=UPI0025CF9151|nr:hypothetical protein [Sphingomonas sp.]